MLPYREDIDNAVAVLREGGVILYPTDTIWGLGCDAEKPQAAERIFRIKRRPPDKSFIILMEGEEMLRHYFPQISDRLAAEISHTKQPTTFILSGTGGIAPRVIAADGTVAVRIPQDPFCRTLLKSFGKALVSTSANFAGAPSPAHFAGIDPALIKETDYVVHWRQDDRTPARPSRIIRILPGGTRTIIRK